MSSAQAVQTEPLSFLWWPERQQQFDFLLHLLTYSDLSVCIEGAEGSGKTEIIKRALNRMGQDLGWVAWVDARTLQQPLDVHYEQLTESRSKAIHMLVLDNADALDTDDWQLVESWLTAGAPRLLLTTRKNHNIGHLDTRLHQIQLNPLPKEQARSCWKKVYGEQSAVPAAVWPGDLTNPKPQKRRPSWSQRLPRGHILALGCILISLGIALYFQFQIEQQQPSDEAVVNNNAPSPIIDPLERLIQARTPQVPTSTGEALTGADKNLSQVKKKEQVTEGAKASEITLPTDKKATESVSRLEKNDNENSPKRQDALEQWLAQKKPNTPIKKEKEKTEKKVSQEQQKSSEITSYEKKSEAVERVSYNQNAKDSLLTLPSQHYTYQLLGTRSRKNADRFMKKYKSLGNDWWVYRGMFKGSPWHVVLYGQFKTKIDAEKVKNTFPKSLQSQKPWLRKFESIQKEIRSQ